MGSTIVAQINGELVKWCEAFPGRGHATWPMPERRRGLYAAWKHAAGKEWMTCGIDDSRRKNCRPPGASGRHRARVSRSARIPLEFRQDYLSLQLAALPGWAGFIKRRAEEMATPGSRPIPLVW